MKSFVSLENRERVLGLAVFLVLCLIKDCYSAGQLITESFGGTATMPCERPVGSSSVAWMKSGKKIMNTPKTITSGDYTLYIFCLEPLDSDVYTCMNGNQAVKSFKLIVKNPENKSYFLMYNQNLDECLWILGRQLHLGACKTNDCKQKWTWTKNQQLQSGIDHSLCVSVHQLSVGEKVFMESCNPSKVLQKWECKGDGLLGIQGADLYFNYRSKPSNGIFLLQGTGVWSHWVKYSTRGSICRSRRVVLSPTRLVLSEGSQGKLVCRGINVINASYAWLRNGELVRESSPSLHPYGSMLVVPFAYLSVTDNYTCIVNDSRGKLKATTTIEVFHDPSVIRHSLNKIVNVGKDFCFGCQMYTTKNLSVGIKWYKNGSPASPENRRFNISIMQKGKFNKLWTHFCINSVQLGDKGNYKCEIESSNSSYSKEGVLQVYAKPRVYITDVGDHMIMCSASGYPPPSLTWYKDSKKIKDNRNDEESLTIKETGGNYTCFASNSVGTSSESFDSAIFEQAKGDKLPLGVIIGGSVGFLLAVVIIIFIICCYCRRKKMNINNNDTIYHTVRYTAAPGEYATPTERPPRTRIEFQPRSSTDPGPKRFSLKERMYSSMKPRSKMEWEVPRECIKLDTKLGEGQFGQVWKGHLLSRKESKVVAIKMLRENPSNKDRKDLFDELEFMKTMTPHPNIVGLVGCCTRSEDVMIIVEFVSHGNLKEYLLKSRGHNRDTYANLAPYSTSLSSIDLISFAYQIARGMSYLEKMKCVHRDLAARNILVGDDKTCKIADFGLARDVYSENYYRKTNGGRLPLRWMAYESVFNGISTSQSDVWSFGILLWEIVTLGGNPYPNMNRDELLEALQRGYRMPKPHHCSDEVYAVMWECWQQNPDKRPTFAELTASFLRFISLQQIFINIDNFGAQDYVNVGSYEMKSEN